MKQQSLDLSKCPWTLYGTMPYAWRNALSIELGLRFEPEIGPVPASVPGSVQQALLQAGIIPDWRYDLNSRNIEWLEHRHWIFACELPSCDDFGDSLVDHAWMLDCEGLDHAGWVYVNAKLVGTFANSFVPHHFTIPKDQLKKEGNILRIIFREPPRWLGQLGYTSRIRDWKPRYYYTWDWIPRVVQTAVTGSLMLRNTDVASGEILSVDCAYTHALRRADLSAKIAITGSCVNGQSCNAPTVVSVKAQLLDFQGQVVGLCEVPADPSGYTDIRLEDLSVDAWYPNRFGKQVVYRLQIQVLDNEGNPIWQDERQVGFKEVVWQPCAGAPKEATAWICEVNGTRLFLQGVNWTPLSPTFADVRFAEVEKRLKLYRDMGCNLLRIWGGAVLETEAFYEACDCLGLMVWQELPLSSSGIDNWPPEDPELIQDMLQIARSYIQLRMHHVSLLMYTGGNELQGDLDGSKTGVGKPVDNSHPMMRELGKLFESLDVRRRFLPTSPFGPCVWSSKNGQNGSGNSLFW